MPQSSDGPERSPERLAFEAYNNSVNDDKRLSSDFSGKLAQKDLSRSIDERAFAQCKDSADQARRAHLNLVSASGAGLFLHAAPSKANRLHNDPALYVAMLRRWLRNPFADVDTECSLCDGVLDRFGDHALVCPCGGDSTRRHNLLRNMTYHAAVSSNLNPELEKPGLLPQRPLCGS